MDNEEQPLELGTSPNQYHDGALDLVTSFPASIVPCHGQPVRLERVWLVPSTNEARGPSLRGSVAVANLACHKRVTCRFTLDSWVTQSDVAAIYESAILLPVCEKPYDRFLFTIPISNFTSLEQKTLVLCLRYQVLDLDYWDNNNGNNFEVGFRRRPRCGDDVVRERRRRPNSWMAGYHTPSATAAAYEEQQAKLSRLTVAPILHP